MTTETAETIETSEATELPADVRARAREVADGLDRAVAARPDLAVSVWGIGLDALGSMLRNKPEGLPELTPFLRLVVDAWNYVFDGTVTPDIATLLAGSLGELVTPDAEGQ